MLHVDTTLSPAGMSKSILRVFELAGRKAHQIAETLGPNETPVVTKKGKFISREWTKWTEGFRFGAALLVYEVTGDKELLNIARSGILRHMPDQVTNFSVHDHGFQCISTFGTLLRLAEENRFEASAWEREYYRLALRCSGAVQARRWTSLPEDGFIYSFNGPHSLFIDTLRTLRSLAVAHRLGQFLRVDGNERISLLDRLLAHARTTVRYNIYYGEGRDAYDVPGRVAHEAIFNTADGSFRCPSTQQGYSPFSTWTRGLAWAILGCAELLEFLADGLPKKDREAGGVNKTAVLLEKAARATADFYLANTPTDGIPYWDTGAPGLANMGDYLDRPAEPYNDHEPVDSSAAAIASQGLLRLAECLSRRHKEEPHVARYRQAGLTALQRLMAEPYLSTSPQHQGLLLHGVYHRPREWDHIPPGRSVPCGEATMWGDYHLLETALWVHRMARGQEYLTFYRRAKPSSVEESS